MSYTGFNSQGGVHHCFSFYERMIKCAKTESLPLKMCTLETEDWLECINKRKQQFLNFKLHQELHKYKIISIPKYDEDKMEFVVDHNLPSADAFFEAKH